jgi:uncharacterized Zn finger protein (UPF0148 family)
MNDALRTCPACGFRVFDGKADSRVACPVCAWIDDFGQLVHPDFVVGANPRSLREAQARARDLSASAHARDPAWRPLAPGEHPRDGRSASPICYLGTPEPEEFVPYWLSSD